MRLTPDRSPPDVRILGAGCARCRALADRTAAALGVLGIDVPIEMVGDPWSIADYGVMYIPALVVDGRVLISGRVPKLKTLCSLIEGAIKP